MINITNTVSANEVRLFLCDKEKSKIWFFYFINGSSTSERKEKNNTQNISSPVASNPSWRRQLRIKLTFVISLVILRSSYSQLANENIEKNYIEKSRNGSVVERHKKFNQSS
jgi:hypothetical protein